jgi:hypothetical protein
MLAQRAVTSALIVTFHSAMTNPAAVRTAAPCALWQLRSCVIMVVARRSPYLKDWVFLDLLIHFVELCQCRHQRFWHILASKAAETTFSMIAPHCNLETLCLRWLCCTSPGADGEQDEAARPRWARMVEPEAISLHRVGISMPLAGTTHRSFCCVHQGVASAPCCHADAVAVQPRAP